MAWKTSSAALALSLAAGAGELQRFEAVEPCMGTLVRLTVYTESRVAARRGFDAAFARGRELDQILSHFKPESELNRLCRAREATVSADLYAVLRHARDISRKTEGAFDITLAPNGWRRIDLGTARRVRIQPPVIRLDLGGIGKGYTAVEMLVALQRTGIGRALVALSGDLAIGDPPPGAAGWRVGLGGSQRVQLLRNCAVSTSGDSEQPGHILDPRTGLAVHGPAVTVIAPDGWLADALATAAYVAGPSGYHRIARRFPGCSILEAAGGSLP